MEPMKLGYLALSKALFGVVRNRSGEDLNMKPSQIAAQLYSFRDFRHSGTPAGVPDTLKRLRAIGYESVQLSSALPRDAGVRTGPDSLRRGLHRSHRPRARRAP